MANKKEVVHFQTVINPGEKKELTEMVKTDGTVERVAVRFYTGQQKSLHVMPEIIHKGEKREPMITYPEGTDPFLSGDDDRLDYPIVLPVEYDDLIRIVVENVDPSNAYTLNCDVVIDYYGGKNRVIGGFING